MTAVLDRALAARTRLSRVVARTGLRGSRHLCSTCGWTGRQWWRTYRCPRCGSFPRHRLLPLALERFAADVADATVLHVASGPTEMRYLRGAGAVLAVRVDLFTADGDVAGDVRALPLRSASVDTAVLWHVLEHVDDDEEAAREVARVLRPGGKAIVSVPVHPPARLVTLDGAPGESAAERDRIHGHPDHVRSCGLDYGHRLAAAAGLHLAEVRVAELPEDIVERFGLDRDHVVWSLAATRDVQAAEALAGAAARTGGHRRSRSC